MPIPLRSAIPDAVPYHTYLPSLDPVPCILPDRPMRPCKLGLETGRLRLRRWQARDLVPFVNLCRDPEVLRFFNGLLSPSACFDEIERQESCFDMFGYGLWAVEEKATGEFIGAVGLEPTMLSPQGMTGRLTWKLRPEHWGKGYACEAGQRVLDYAFEVLQVKEVFAPVDPSNIRSLRLIQRLGLEMREAEPHCFYKAAA